MYEVPANTCRIAVPPGVGDTYWALAKLQDFRQKKGLKHVTLCVKKAELKRALAWPKMVDFVEAAEEFDFEPNKGIRETGYSARKPGVNYVFWPNSVIDRGHHLSEWMPNYKLNLDFDIKTNDRQTEYMGKHVIYASSHGVNDNWFPDRGPAFWRKLINEMAERTGELPLVIGAGWDAVFLKSVNAQCIDTVGKTDLPQVAGVIKNAKSLTGIISGMTILGNHFRTPTVAIYPDRFLPGFLTAWIKPDTPYTTLKASETNSPSGVAKHALDIAR